MTSDSELEIAEIAVREVDIPLMDRFTISRGSIPVAGNLFVRVALRNGTVGYGECAPFPDLTGEDRETTISAVKRLGETIADKPVAEFRDISRLFSESAPQNPAARCGLETAILDTLCRNLGVPMWAFFGGRTTQRYQTDITIPMVGRERSLELAGHWYELGFRILKLKVGKDPDSDLAIITEISRRFPDISLVVDANQGFSETEALNLISSLKSIDAGIRLLEQPVDKRDLDAMARLRSESPFPICADESVATRQDAARIFKASAADVINVKIMKSGVIEAFDIAMFALAGGIGVMFGGMIETRLAMGCSLAMAAGIGRVHTLDLDTPLLMTEDPLVGGFRYDGPEMILSREPGLGVTPKDSADAKLWQKSV